MIKLLIADDNKQITSIIEEYAKKEGYETIVAFDGETALEKFNNEMPSVVLLDVMMPKLDGFQVCKEIRKTSNIPVIMVTAKGEDYEKIMGLELGADDYIVKPFSPREVMARIKAIMRRIHTEENQPSHVFQFENLKVSLDDYKVTINNIDVPLTKKELELLYTLATNENKVFSRDNLLTSLWGYDYFGDTRTVDSHIKRLRAKVDAFPDNPWEIKTIWGVGYRFEVKNHDEK